MTNAFSALDYEHQLEAAGVTSKQAEVHARALGQVQGEVAYGTDLKRVESNLQQEIRQSEQRVVGHLATGDAELKSLINTCEAGLKALITVETCGLRDKFTQRFAELEVKIETGAARTHGLEQTVKMYQWVFALIITIQMGTLAAVLRLLIAGPL